MTNTEEILRSWAKFGLGNKPCYPRHFAQGITFTSTISRGTPSCKLHSRWSAGIMERVCLHIIEKLSSKTCTDELPEMFKSHDLKMGIDVIKKSKRWGIVSGVHDRSAPHLLTILIVCQFTLLGFTLLHFAYGIFLFPYVMKSRDWSSPSAVLTQCWEASLRPFHSLVIKLIEAFPLLKKSKSPAF